MSKLTLFELEKIWKKRSFLLAILMIVLAHLFLLWYTNLPDGENPDLSSYKYPLRQFSIPLDNIPAFSQSGLKLPVIILMLVMLLAQMLTFVTVTQVVIFISGKGKSYLSSLFIGVFLLLIPLLLAVMGFSFAVWISLLPLYEITSLIAQEYGLVIAAVYGFAAALILIIGKRKRIWNVLHNRRKSVKI